MALVGRHLVVSGGGCGVGGDPVVASGEQPGELELGAGSAAVGGGEPDEPTLRVPRHPAPAQKHLAEILLRPAVAARALDRQALRRGGVPALGLGRILGDARAALVELRQRQLGVETAGLRRDPIVWHGRRRIGLGTPAALQELPDLEAGRDVTARRRLAIERQSRDRILLDPPTLLVQPG